MIPNLRVILSAAGVAALLASPATAKTRHHYGPLYGTYYGAAGPYTPNAPTRRHGYSHDFQDGSRG